MRLMPSRFAWLSAAWGMTRRARRWRRRELGGSDTHLIYHNGVLELQADWNFTAYPESGLNSGIFKIGYTSTDFPQSHGLYGKLGEIIKIDQILDEEHRILIHAYLASKWGISSEVDSDGDGVVDSSDTAPFDAGSN